MRTVRFADVPKATISSYVKVLGIGFMSLVAGASPGPEAVLVPACVLIGSILAADSKAKAFI